MKTVKANQTKKDETNMANKLQQKIKTLKTEMIVSCLWEINKPWDKFSPAERKTRSCLLEEFENREGEDAVMLLMDKLEDAVGELVD